MYVEVSWIYVCVSQVCIGLNCFTVVSVYRIAGYIRSRNFRRTTDKLNFEGFIFVLLECHQMLANTRFNFEEFNFCRSDAIQNIRK